MSMSSQQPLKTTPPPSPGRRFGSAVPTNTTPAQESTVTMHNGGGRHFDLQAHRGGRGLVVESTLAGFANALELGVSTLELDVQITRDRHVVVSHDRQVSATICQDTGPALPNDPIYPYVGKYI